MSLNIEHTTSSIHLSRKSLQENLSFIRSVVGKDVVVSSVVKGNAYGHGIETFTQLAYKCGVRHFSVFSGDEAYSVYHSLPGDAEIMIMGFLRPEQLDWAIRKGISFFAFTFQILEQSIELSRKHHKKARVHIEVETGMNRTGFDQKNWDRVIGLLKNHEAELEVSGLCTHFAGAESIANYYRNEKQKEVYKKAVELFKKNDIHPKRLHTCCSAAMMRYPEMHYDMVRVGIMQYGFWPSPEIFTEYVSSTPDKHSPLKRLISWTTQVMSVKSVNTGEFIGYGTNFMAPYPMRIAIIPVGYAHGFSRSMSNQGKVLVRGKVATVVGMVNMNSIAVDITDIPNVDTGDEVILIGKKGRQERSVASFSELSSQLNYELLTRLPFDIPRKIVK